VEKRSDFLLTIITVLLTGTGAFAQQFPIGLYSGAANNTQGDYLTQIYNLGANTVIYPVNMSDQPSTESGRFQNIIPSNAYSANDKVHYYSGGYWSTWIPQNPNPNLQGDEALVLQKVFGTIVTETINNETFEAAHTGNSYSASNDIFITGPGYKQDYRYSTEKRRYDVNPFTNPVNLINYKTVFTMKLGNAIDLGASGDEKKICEISVCIDNNPVLTKEVFENDFNDKISNGYSEILLENSSGVSTYNYSASINATENVPNVISPQNTPNPSGQGETYKTIQFKVRWFGHRMLYVKQVDVYDNVIGLQLKETPITSQNDIINYLNGTGGITSHFSEYTNISNWYGLDEPSTIDSYKPYRVVNSIIQSVSVNANVRKPLLSAFSPYYQPEFQYWGDKTFPRWIREAKPDILMFDFYPINKEAYPNGVFNINRTYQQFNFLRSLLSSAANHTDMTDAPEKFYYVGQAHSYFDASNPSTRVYQPDIYQFNTSAMLALAHGAKGLLFYNYLSDGSNQGIDVNLALSTAFTNLANRLKGTFGDKMLSLKYLKEYLRVYGNTYTGDEGPVTFSTQPNSPISLSIPNDGVKRSFVGGVFTAPNESASRYLFLVNACPESGSKSASFGLHIVGVNTVYGTNNTFNNISLSDFESAASYSVSVNSSPTITMNNSEGKLFKLAPVVKYGGRITANETINTATTLTAPMTIAAGCTLSVRSAYTINSDITVEDGGAIILPEAGNIILNNGAKINQSW
jgi:hypothetical protein